VICDNDFEISLDESFKVFAENGGRGGKEDSD
jgi:hypothetical protein